MVPARPARTSDACARSPMKARRPSWASTNSMAAWTLGPMDPAVNSPAPKSFPACATVSRSIGSARRSEEHTSELQSHHDLVCRLLLEKKKKKRMYALHSKKKKNQKNT